MARIALTGTLPIPKTQNHQTIHRAGGRLRQLLLRSNAWRRGYESADLFRTASANSSKSPIATNNSSSACQSTKIKPRLSLLRRAPLHLLIAASGRLAAFRAAVGRAAEVVAAFRAELIHQPMPFADASSQPPHGRDREDEN